MAGTSQTAPGDGGGSGDGIEGVLHRLLAMLAAHHEFEFPGENVAGFGVQALAKSFYLVLAQCDPNFADLIDRGELAQRVNKDGNAGQFGELLGGLRLLRPGVFVA